VKDGERLVWAAAFAQAMNGLSEDADDATIAGTVGTAIGRAHIAVKALRKISEISPKTASEPWAMLRDMAEITN
jgi:hypothetical protein